MKVDALGARIGQCGLWDRVARPVHQGTSRAQSARALHNLSHSYGVLWIRAWVKALNSISMTVGAGEVEGRGMRRGEWEESLESPGKDDKTLCDP
jgi:hypothetical protein